MQSVQSLPPGRLKKLLLRKNDTLPAGEISKADNGKVVVGEVVSAKETAVRRDATPEEPTTIERGYMSDSSASSVDDHLVDPEMLDLDETFFSPTYQSQSVPCSAERMNEDEGSDVEPSYIDAAGDEDEDKMLQIFSQITHYERQVSEANACYQSWEIRAKESQEHPEMLTACTDVPSLLTQAEGMAYEDLPKENGQEWHVCEEQQSTVDERKGIEIFVSNASHKSGRIVDVAQSLRRLEQEQRKKQFLEAHKVHLLLLLGYGIQVNRTLNICVAEYASELYDLLANSDLSMAEQVDFSLINAIVYYYKENVKLSSTKPGRKILKTKTATKKQLLAREASCRRMYNVLLLVVLRFLGIRARFVMHLDVVPKSPPASKTPAKSKIDHTSKPSSKERYDNVALTTAEILKRKPEMQKMFHLSQLDGADGDSCEGEVPAKKGRLENLKPRLWKLKPNVPCNETTNTRESQISQNVCENEHATVVSKYFRKTTSLKQLRSANGMEGCHKVETAEHNPREESPEKGRLENAKPRLWKLKSKLPHNKTTNVRDSTLIKSSQTSQNVDENEECPVVCKYFRKTSSQKQRRTKRPNKLEPVERKPVSPSKLNLSRLIMHKTATVSNENRKKKYRVPELDMWIECFLEAEQRWTVVEAALGQADCMEQVIDLIQDPPVYAFAFEANGQTVVDVTPRYWWRNEPMALRQRVDKKWLQKCLHAYRPPKNDVAFLLEQLEFRQLKFRAPMPTTVAQFKNHPSYCLARHLQKFQGIYPPDAPPLGFINGGEPVYARECVQTLHSREVWLRHAKVIRMHEQPYKIVKSKLRREQINLELFGHWQTEEYVPPEPVDGIVPRNAYGNIEIFKDCMLPKGTVHLKQYGLSYICRKLGIDFAVAVVGFGVHAGGNHPVFDGIVICEEHRDRLLEAWAIHQEEQAEKKKEKKRQIVLKNWVKLVKGLLVRRRLQNKYNFDGM